MFTALELFKSPSDPDNTSSSAVNYITTGSDEPVCTVYFEFIDGCDLIREIVNCKHVFHRECLDKWVDVGQVNCPLCRSMLLPSKKLLSTTGFGVLETAVSDVAPVMKSTSGDIPILFRQAEAIRN
ncbi:putative transcription factor C2H2 family [Helianthus anomalus]